MKYITNSKSPMSIILDSSTDVSQHHYLVVYLQSLEDYTPVLYFYKLIPLQIDESAAGHFNVLQKQWQEEKLDLTSHIKRNLVAFASDGAPVMMGKSGGLKKLLSDWIGKPLFSVHCMAHRLQLAILKALSGIPYFAKFEDLLNEIFHFYNRHGHKRKAHLWEMASILNIKMYEVSYIYKTRWISSELQAITRVNSSWYLLVTDLYSISEDNEFPDATRATAKGISKRLKGKHFLIMLQFLLDVLRELAYWSKNLQRRAATLIGMELYKNQMLQTFDALTRNNGPSLQDFLNHVTCSQLQSRMLKCTLPQYYTSISNTWQNIDLVEDNDFPMLDNIK